MLDYEVGKCSQRCARSGRDLQAGETYYSELRFEAGNLVRLDYAAESWAGPSDGAVGWWKAQVPDGTHPTVSWAPKDVMLNLLDERLSDPSAGDLCYVLALLMIRRKILRLDTTEKDASGNEVLILFAPTSEQEFRVPVVEPSPERTGEIQELLATLKVIEQ